MRRAPFIGILTLTREEPTERVVQALDELAQLLRANRRIVNTECRH